MGAAKTIRIAIDGPSGSGKSTLARRLAKALGFVYIDTGSLYRAIGLVAARAGVPPEKPEGVCALLQGLDLEMRLEDGGSAVYLDGQKLGDEIRTTLVTQYTSQVSKIPQVRAFLLETQRETARKYSVVMGGTSAPSFCRTRNSSSFFPPRRKRAPSAGAPNCSRRANR